MEIISREQAVLNLIIKYRDNPGEVSLESTLKEIRKYWPQVEDFKIQHWGVWNLTPASEINLLNKYFPEVTVKKGESYVLEVDCKTLSMRYVNFEEVYKRLKETTMLGI